MEDGIKITPMMKQFLELKEQYNDCILLFRAGDFYETFYDDAKICSKTLGITLTKRGETPMAGVPYHSIMPYIKKLIQNNFKIAMCEQLEDPKLAKGLVKRGITRIITPGTILEDEFINSFENNFIMCIFTTKNPLLKFGISLIDISTGEFLCSQCEKFEELKTLIKKYLPNEIILNENKASKEIIPYLKNSNIYFSFLSEIRFNLNYANEILKKQFFANYNELGLNLKEESVIACGAILFYIHKLQKLELNHLNKIKFIDFNKNLILDSISLKNLEIIESIFSQNKSKTLFGILNNCKTPMGSRLLKKNLVSPFLDEEILNNIYDSIDELNENIFQRDEIINILDNFSDIERITSRISSKIASPKDLLSLKYSLEKLPKLKENLLIFKSKNFINIKSLDTLKEVTELIEKSINEDAPNHLREIGYIKKDYNPDLKELFEISQNSKKFIKEMEDEEKLKTGIPSLKIKYNKIFGYYIEIPNNQVSKIPNDYKIKQNLANAIRYTKESLKEKENLILNAEDKIKSLEKELFEEIINQLENYIKKIQEISKKIAMLDLLTTHSINSQYFKYIRPQFDKHETIIEDGRNPIVEKFVSSFIPNDINFNENETFKIITGPNMSGKSTYLRQTALISILAQSGSFIPAKKAKLKIYKRIFTRIGAHDELAEGQSTFMVEMLETANILNNADENSLILLDEIGRGTSTYDGLAIAWAITEELSSIKAHSIFATHYHQLNKLSQFYENIQNYNVLVREEGENIEFIHKIIKGGTDKSYGIYVGKLAGIPQKILDRAKEIQENIEEKEEIKITKNFIPIKNKRIEKEIPSKNLDTFFN